MNRNSRIWKRLVVLAVATLVLGIFGTSIVIGQDEVAVPSVEDFLSVSIAIDTVWVMISSIIVFFMQAWRLSPAAAAVTPSISGS